MCCLDSCQSLFTMQICPVGIGQANNCISSKSNQPDGPTTLHLGSAVQPTTLRYSSVWRRDFKGVSIPSNCLIAEMSSESRPRPHRGSVRVPEFRRAARRGFAPRERTAKAPPGPYLGRCSRAAGPRRTSSACCPSREGCSRSARHHIRQP
jgi:hypothetical protein